MISRDALRNMCLPPATGKAYFGPFTFRGNISLDGILFVGINPATPITPEEIGIEEYIDLITDYESFVRYYKNTRLQNGKTEISRTRVGMNAFLDAISSYTSATIFETDVIPYPTANLKLLKKEPKFIVERGKEIFFQLVQLLTPRLIIVHGKKSADHLTDIFVENKLISNANPYLEMSIEEMEENSPLFEFNYNDGKKGTVMVCRHFMYYGLTGNLLKLLGRRLLL